jgi:hypothetical protein
MMLVMYTMDAALGKEIFYANSTLGSLQTLSYKAKYHKDTLVTA